MACGRPEEDRAMARIRALLRGTGDARLSVVRREPAGRRRGAATSSRKDEVVRYYFWQARQWIEKGKMHLKYCNDGGYRLSDEVLWESCRGACRCLHAVLTQHEVDFRPKVLRWNLPALFKKARKWEPALGKFAPYIEGLPNDLAFLDLEAVDGLDTNPAFTDLRAAVVWR